MKRIIRNNYKIIIGILIGIVLSITTVYAVESYIESNKVTYNNHNKENVQEAIDELYERSGMHKEKWKDSVLNGADPVLKDPLIPVEIKNDGTVYYANENSEWYNYKEKRWANAVILIDNPSNTNYGVGDHILESDIESYFVWIPRYQYKVWDLGNYYSAIDGSTITNANNNLSSLSGNSRIIDIKFGTAKDLPRMAEPNATGVYYTHPAFTIGDKDLNGIWVGKFETGYKDAIDTTSAQVDNIEVDSVIIKPDVYSWRGISIKNTFMTSFNYERNLDSHMFKNTEWGAVAYLSHSAYGIGTETRINNTSDYKTGYSVVANYSERDSGSNRDLSSNNLLTQPWYSSIGYLASTTGNISGIYDMSGGASEGLASCLANTPGISGFDVGELTKYMQDGYIDRYESGEQFNYRILGDATGELGPFYLYVIENEQTLARNAWYYSSVSVFINSSYPWVHRGRVFSFGLFGGAGHPNVGYRISLAPQN